MTTQTIFDSKKATTLEEETTRGYFDSSMFQIQAGETAHLILTTNVNNLIRQNNETGLLLYVLRLPKPLQGEDHFSPTHHLYSYLTDAKPNQPLKDNNKVYLGYNPDTQNTYSYITIDKPGSYVLYGRKVDNIQLSDQRHPTIVELSMEVK